ncbi:hypothetical protein KFK09_005092 [Dendrobium nobile]|uniref:Uncharacterized protein n=1 Tax=Dendrobium nobile TaxID=94219 RepID=A0A8T3BUW3_DENNO|nr:hypothetical protein KFK09_005092 [Dendrobium nobile]
MVGFGALWGTRVLQIVKRNDSPGLLWKKIKLTTTRKNNAKKRLRRVWQEHHLNVPKVQLFPFHFPYSFNIHEYVASPASTIWG